MKNHSLVSIVRTFAAVFLLILSVNVQGQTIVINEVSQGPSGSAEYVEFLVLGPALVNCDDTPPCIDLRGWIFDDNNGNLNPGGPMSGVGIATGACRFSNDPFWACVPAGTIILIYNDADIFPGLSSDTDMSDCSVSVPISSALFEKHTTQPTSSNSTYATTGWVSGGGWTQISMANGGDGFQIVDPSNPGTPVHSVGWDENSNVDIYFSTSSMSGDVVYATDCDPTQQSSWVYNTNALGGGTPGSPNPGQADCIGNMNANCNPPTVTIASTPESCTGACDGTATATITGGTSPYDLTWSPAPGGGQGTVNATGLCAGTYTLTLVDDNGNGCTLDTDVTISSGGGSTTPTFNPVAAICSGDALAALPTTSTNGITGSWSPALDNTATTTYTFTPTAGQCATTTTLTITVNPLPTFTVTPSNPTSCLLSNGTITISGLDPNTVYIVNDGSGPLVNPSDASGEIVLSGYGPTTINSITIEDQNTGCTTVDNTGWTLTAPSAPTITVNSDQTICEGESVTLSSTISSGTVSWVDNFTITYSEGDIVSPLVTTTYTATASDNGCNASASFTITVTPEVTPTFNPVAAICSGDALAALPSTSTNGITGTWSPALDNTATTTYTFTPTSGQCATTTTLTITVNSPTTNTVNVDVCDGDSYTFADGSTSTITASTSLVTTLTGANGCDSVVTENITMLPVYNITENVNACENSTYTFPDASTQVITANTSYTSNLTSAGGCDSIIVTNVTMDPIQNTTVNTDICSGSNFTYADGTVSNNITANESHVSTLTSAAGCDSIVTESLNIVPSITNTVNIDVCENGSYTFADGSTSTITASTSLVTTLVSANGCDSVVTENITMLPIITNTVNVDVCDGDSYTFADGSTSTITANTSLTTTLTAASGCDSVVTENISILPIFNIIENINACENSTFTYPDGTTETITMNTSHTSSLIATNGCDSIIVTNVIMDLVYNITENVNACENASFTYPDGIVEVITANTSHTSSLVSISGCDSIIVTNVTMNPIQSTSMNIDICSGSNFTYADGTISTNITINESHASTLTDINGCDSVVTENLNIVPQITNTVNVDVCENNNYTFADGSTSLITASTSLTTTLTGVNGCDSVVTENITMLPIITNTVIVDVCENTNYTFADGSTQVITASTTLTTTLAGTNGCDSVVTENITMLPFITNSINVDVCENDSYTFADGSTSAITANTSLTTTLTSASGCDSVVTENITMLSPVANTVNVDVCENDNYTFADGSTSAITANTSLTTVLTAANGCDSMVTENVTMLPVYNITENVIACENSTYTFPDASTQVITGNTSYTSNLTSAGGCDSIIVTNVTMDPNLNSVNDIFACENSTVTYPDGTSEVITGNTSQTSTLTSITGCDSIVVTNVTMNPVYAITENVTICEGETVSYPDGTSATLTSNTTYISNLLSNSGCDSVITTNVIVNPNPSFNLASTDPTTCGATDGTITISGLTATTSYDVVYNGLNVTLIADGTGNILISPLASGVYTGVQITDPNGCYSEDLSTIVINDVLPASITNIDKIDVACFGDSTGSVQINTAGGNGALSFQIDNGQGLNLSNATGVFANLPAGNYSVIITDALGCQIMDQFVINQPSQIVPNISSSNVLCFGEANGSITITNVNGGNPPYVYSIDNGLNYSPTATFTGLSAGTYGVTVQDQGGCQSDTSEIIIGEPNELLLSLNDLTVIQPNCVNGSPLCNGSVSLAVPAGSGTPPFSYNWPNGIAQPGSNAAVDLCAGLYNISVQDANGCATSIQVTITAPNIPVITNVDITESGCGGECVGTVDIQSDSVVVYFLNSTSQPTGYFQNLCAGTYFVEVENSAGCTASQQITIQDAPMPYASFIFEPPFGTVVDPTINFNNLAEFATDYFWTIENIYPTDYYYQTTTDSNFTHIFPSSPGSYLVCLNVSNNQGCTDQYCSGVTIRDDYTLYVPNAFTPDGNGLNESFKPILNGIDEQNYELLIFNRWGELLFESHNKEVGWNGVYRGDIVQDGVYVWQIRFKLKYTDERITKRGHVTILK
ncbi:MAG: gliding motility-associated C-terminal domain-containing protein [Crocinitomicaceae bacterium]